MAIIDRLSVQFTPAQQTAILGDVNAAIAALNAVQVVTLTKEERQSIHAVAEERIPYVLKAVNNLGPAYPALIGPAIPTVSAQDALNSWAFLKELGMAVAELQDRLQDLGLNLGNTALTYMDDLYDNGKRYTGQVVGADVVVDELKGAYEGQGPQTPIVPNP